MSDSAINRVWVLAERPQGAPDQNTLRLEEQPIPEPGPGEMLLRHEWLSVDPYMRGRMSDAKSYATPVEIGAPMVGGTVGRVARSKLDGFAEGDLVVSQGGWRDYSVSDGAMALKLDAALERPSWALGVLGMPGFTAWAGLTQIGQPEAGETLVVAAATGPVGATVGQIGKIMGCRVVGVAGGPEKCRHAVEQQGFDACIDHKAEDFDAQLAAATPDGIDIYFENVGGHVLRAVLPRLNTHARVPVCGLAAQYNATGLPDGPDHAPLVMGVVLTRRVTMRGFIIFDDFGALYPQFAEQMAEWVKTGAISYTEEVIEGLEAAPEALYGLLRGENFGKRVVKLV